MMNTSLSQAAAIQQQPQSAQTQRSSTLSRRSPQASASGPSSPSRLVALNNGSVPVALVAQSSGHMVAETTQKFSLPEMQYQQQQLASNGSIPLSQRFPAGSDVMRPTSPTPPVAPHSRKAAGLIDVNRKNGAILEFSFSLLAGLTYIGCWIYLLNADCYQHWINVIFVKCFTVLGAIMSLFTLFHSCFDRRMTIGRGIIGCILFFLISVVVFINLMGAFFAANCNLCRCKPTFNAFNAPGRSDLVIFCLEILASIFLLVVLMISAVVHN